MSASPAVPPDVFQTPKPGESRVMFCGDRVRFALDLSTAAKGEAYIRTNLGRAGIARQEIINRVEKNDIKLGGAWHDIPMQRDGGKGFCIELPLDQPGHFQAKCFFIPEKSGTLVWPDPSGGNTVLNVEPAGTCCANIIYNAFVRQFGPSKSRGDNGAGSDGDDDRIKALDDSGYTVIPPSGKFRDLKEEVAFIFDTLGCRVLHLLPVHPTPTTYARMGRFGSPYAALSFTAVDPALAVFDPGATPLEQFTELVDAVHFHGGCLFMDIAINHTGWAAALHETHPEWLVRGKDGKITAPGAWGVVWEDLTKLDYSHTGLWQYMADIFLLWCRRGVDGFRCDAGYMIPVAAWEYITAKVRQAYPDTLFFLEGLGGPKETTRKILGPANFNWAYSELFQTHTREEISSYLPFALSTSESFGPLIHFAETHDNNRLAGVSRTFARMRTAMCALFSVCGGFGFANGVEWFAKEKIDVHACPGLNWGARENQVARIARLNCLLKHHPAFFSGARLELTEGVGDEQILVLWRHHPAYDRQVWILVNLDCGNGGTARWQVRGSGRRPGQWTDLLSGRPIEVQWDGNDCRTPLAPGQVLALSHDPGDLLILEKGPEKGMPQRVSEQKCRAAALAAACAFNGYGGLGGLDVAAAARNLKADPVEFIRSLNPDSNEARVIPLDLDRDLERRVMVPPGFFLLVRGPRRFRAVLSDDTGPEGRVRGYGEGLPGAGGKFWFALFAPQKSHHRHIPMVLSVRILTAGGAQCHDIPLLCLADFHSLRLRYRFTRKEIRETRGLKLMAATRLGAMMRAPALWGGLDSRYDGLLGANLSKTLPENRWMAWARCRIWAVFQGYSRELAPDCLEGFTFSYDNAGLWQFHVPTCQGRYFVLELGLKLDRRENRAALWIRRPKTDRDTPRQLPDDRPVSLIFRPGVEDRSFHDTVKAFQGPETQWPERVAVHDTGFDFSLGRGHLLCMRVSRGLYVHEPQWDYMVHRPLEAQRGLDPDSDLFSPGWFSTACKGGQTVCLSARVTEKGGETHPVAPPLVLPRFERRIPLEKALYKGMNAFLVDRGKDKSVIAGYPWFLDWGRDSLIFCRGLIRLGRIQEALSVLKLFGRFEDKGTLPNMICGANAGNIETSDAPLWFFACLRDMARQLGETTFLDRAVSEDPTGKTFRDVLLSIARWLIRGTPTGVKADPDSQLLYSPAHFTWMDTNFPAGTPRQGYPVEIQALWCNALDFLAEIDGSQGWKEKAERVRAAVNAYFWDESLGYFADCLHSGEPLGAARAVADDALRPNQLLLICLGGVTDRAMARKSVEACLELLVPGGIRSLANRPLSHPLAVFHNGRCLKDPHAPYSGKYEGDEDSMRKPAYHNGTAWTWPFPLFCEAWAKVFGPESHATCLAWLGSTLLLLRQGAAGYIPEIMDGDAPHTPRGCDAQAWGVSEAARVVKKLMST